MTSKYAEQKLKKYGNMPKTEKMTKKSSKSSGAAYMKRKPIKSNHKY